MGDIIETTVHASEHFVYYKVSNNKMWFEIKSHGMALVGLATVPNGRCQWIEFTNPGRISFTGRSDPKSNQSGLPFTLTADSYCRFWIAWNSKYAWIGIGDNLEIVVSSNVSPDLKYITFATRDMSPSIFKFEVPPLILKIPLVSTVPKITGGKPHWKRCENQLPDEAVIGGYIDGEVVYVVRARLRQSLTPGVFVPSKGLAYIPWGGSDNPTANFEALCGFNLVWKPATKDTIPVDAFIGGYSEVHREPLYVARAKHNKHVIPGKMQLSHRVCYIPYEGKEVAVKNFEILTQPGLNEYSENDFVFSMAPIRFGGDREAHYEENEDEEDDDDNYHERAYAF